MNAVLIRTLDEVIAERAFVAFRRCTRIWATSLAHAETSNAGPTSSTGSVLDAAARRWRNPKR
jgi:hypothetical protein